MQHQARDLHGSRGAARALFVLAATVLATAADGRHVHQASDGPRYVTDRPDALELPLPGEEDAFTFAIFGDRTGGPPEGVEVLKDAVRDVNLFAPDLVMTVGDLIQGYNRTPEWMVQMREFKDVMGGLAMPWFPVAGNHDVYWRGDGKPAGEHEASYEEHFGPLWYAFRHKSAWFVVLYTDEGNPDTGEKAFQKPDCQRISDEQLAWLDATLARTGDAEHVFVFLHHPRWRGGQYGDDWERVHARLVAAGNVTACFAGHIHRMIYDGTRDGIEYFALATTGGILEHDVPEAGFLHHYHLVTVRPERISIAAVPVGAVLDPRAVTAEVSDLAIALDERLRPGFAEPLAIVSGRAVDRVLRVGLENPAARPIELELRLASADARWVFDPDHHHPTLAAGERATLEFRVRRAAAPLDDALHLPELSVACDVLAEGLRFRLPDRTFPVPVRPSGLTSPAEPRVLALDGVDDHLRLEHAQLALPDGPFTVEGWLRARELPDQQAFVAKTQSSEFGLFTGAGKPAFLVHLGGAYVRAAAAEPLLEPDRWHHLAGVYDGAELRLYLDGALVARTPASGARTQGPQPLLVGADPDGKGRPGSLFAGFVDEVRISRGARYVGERFEPSRRMAADDATLLLLHMESGAGPWAIDASGREAHPLRRGGVREVEAPQVP